MELLDLGVEIGKNWYSIGNTEYDVFHVFALRFKDFIRIVNLFWTVCLSVMVMGNR